MPMATVLTKDHEPWESQNIINNSKAKAGSRCITPSLRKTHRFYTSYAATQEPESDRKIDVLLMKYRNKSYLHGGSICKVFKN